MLKHLELLMTREWQSYPESFNISKVKKAYLLQNCRLNYHAGFSVIQCSILVILKTVLFFSGFKLQPKDGPMHPIGKIKDMKCWRNDRTFYFLYFKSPISHDFPKWHHLVKVGFFSAFAFYLCHKHTHLHLNHTHMHLIEQPQHRYILWRRFVWELKVQISEVKYEAAFHCTQLSSLSVFAFFNQSHRCHTSYYVVMEAITLYYFSLTMTCLSSIIFGCSKVSQQLKQS